MADHPPRSPRPKPAVAVPGMMRATPVAAYGCPPPPEPEPAAPQFPTPEQVRERLDKQRARTHHALRSACANALRLMSSNTTRVPVTIGTHRDDVDKVVAELVQLGWAAHSTPVRGEWVSDDALVVIYLPRADASEGADQ